MACQDSTTPRTCEHCQAPIENRQEHSAKYCTHKCLRAAEYLRDNATIKARSAGYREAHRKELAAAARAYRKDNRDAINARTRTHRASRRKLLRERDKAWRKANPEWLRAYADANRAERNAKCVARQWTLRPEDVKGKMSAQGGKCAGCATSLAEGFHLDHIKAFSRGGASSIDNLQLLCPPCNQSKGNRPCFFPAGANQGRLAL